MLAAVLPFVALLAPEAVTAALGELRDNADQPRTPARCAPFETAAIEALLAQKLTGERASPCVVMVRALGKVPLATLAAKLENVRVRAVFDAGYYVDNPLAAASFDGINRTLRLPESLLASASLDDDVLQHELVHVAIWKHAHEDEKSLLAYLHGGPFQPQDLHLDEMRAYAEDLARAVRELEKSCSSKKTNNTTWAALLETRQKGEPPSAELTGCDKLFDRAAAKLTFGKNHTAPALPALEALSAVSMLSRIEGDDPEVIFKGTLGDAPIELHIASLIPRQSHDYQPLLKALLTQTKTHATHWQKAGEALAAVTKCKPKELPKLMPKLGKAAKVPVATPKL